MPFIKVRPEFNGHLELDGFNEELQLAFEMQGIQHYAQSPKYHRKAKDLHEQIEKDLRKHRLCQRNRVTLLLIPYYIAEKGLEALQPFLHEACVSAFVSFPPAMIQPMANAEMPNVVRA